MERLINIDTDQGPRRARRIVRALIKEGVIGKEDEINVVLQKDDPRLSSGRKATKVEVLTIFRDGERGPIDTTAEIYRVEFL